MLRLAHARTHFCNRSPSQFKTYQISNLRQLAITTIKDAKEKTRQLEQKGRETLLIEGQQDRRLVKYEERLTDMANWMAVTLSARALEGATSNESQPRFQLLPSLRRSAEILPVKKPIWTKGATRSSYMFNADEVNMGVVARYGMNTQLLSPRQVSLP